jgi:hypothetical protein
VGNPSFRIKLLLVAAGLANAVLFRLLWRHRLALWDIAAPPLGKIQAAGSIVLWLGAVAGGRLIAYV